MTIVFNPNSNLVSSNDGGSGAAWPGTLLTISGCTAGNTLLAVATFDTTATGSGNAPPGVPSGWTLDSGLATAGDPGAAIGIAIYRKSSAAAGANAFAPTAPGGASPFFWVATLMEVTPLALDKAPTGVSSADTGTLAGPNTGTLSAAIEFALAACGANQSETVTIPNVPTGFTSAFSSNASVALRAAYEITSVTTALDPSWTSSGSVSMAAAVVTYTDASGGGCTNSGYTSSGAIAIPNGSSGSYLGKSGAFVTPNCSSINYWQPSGGKFGTSLLLPVALLGRIIARRNLMKGRK